ncbi:MAG: phosphotriesterase-related protein [Thermoleophilaceae bacterium]|nr:phosphotriesterase-related protein [Thermoleophilaceae bacterium]
MTQNQGSVVTVLGPVAPDELGPTMMHEHLLVDLGATFAPVDDADLAQYSDEPVGPELIELLHRWPFSLTPDNGRLDDEALAEQEARALVAAGGSALVDCTIDGIGRDPVAVARLAQATGLHIVQGTGYYVELAHPPHVSSSGVDEIASHFVAELTEGIGETGIRAGIIGEIGTSGIDAATRTKRGDITPDEEKVLRAAGAASVETGAAVTVHLDPRGDGADRVVDVLAEEGVAPERMVMDHMDARPDLDYHLRIAARGVFVEYDHFGREYYAPHMGEGERYTQDSRRIELLVELVERGHTAQLLVSQDVCAKIDLHRHGGNGYDHVLLRIVPRLREAGLDDAALRAILVDNPRRALAF